jgi:hypothetical protein
MRLCGWRAAAVLAAVTTTMATVVRGQASPPSDNAELARLFKEDQDDRKPGLYGIDWAKLKPRDDARLARIRELYASDALRTGADWFHAALILQHSNEADDYLLAHEMSVAAVALGHKEARWLTAASEDRFLRKIGRKQRFGTQYEQADKPGRMELAPTEAQVTDALRDALGIQSLAEAKAAASQFDKK